MNFKYRTLAGEKRFLQEAGARKCFWNFDVLIDLRPASSASSRTSGMASLAASRTQVPLRTIIAVELRIPDASRILKPRWRCGGSGSL